MSRKKLSVRIGRREKIQASIGAILGALLGGCIATTTGATATSDIFLTITKYAAVFAIAGMWFRLSMVVEVIVWTTLGAVAGIVASLVAGVIGITKLEPPEGLINGAGLGILVSVVGNSFRMALKWRNTDHADVVREQK